MWDKRNITGNVSWLADSIAENMCLAVTDGSYIMEVYPLLNSTAFVFECTQGRGRIVGYFIKHTPEAGSYQGELLGLIAIHLILKGIHDFSPGFHGSIHIWSD